MRNSAKIRLDNESCRLKYTVEAYEKISQKLGISWKDKAAAKKIDPHSLESLSVFLWAGLLWKNPGPSFKDVTAALEKFEPEGLKKLVPPIEKAMKDFIKEIARNQKELDRITKKKDRLEAEFGELEAKVGIKSTPRLTTVKKRRG